MTTTDKAVETGKVARRALRLATIDQAIEEAERVAKCAIAGKAACAGNWDVGQILNHLGVWAEYAYGGNPVTAPLILRLIAPLFLGRVLRKGMSAGQKIPKLPGGTVGFEKTDVQKALTRMTAAFLRLKTDKAVAVNPLFGRISWEQYVQLNLRHAELHLSFVSG